MDNCSLFDHPIPDPPAHHAAPHGTSDVAARAIKPKAETLRQQVLGAIRAAGPRGLCDFEGQALLNLKAQTYGPRRIELMKIGAVVDSGQRRRTPANRPAAVWIACEYLDMEGQSS